jgi:succinoglycan biosynthesis transport protein ExoP
VKIVRTCPTTAFRSLKVQAHQCVLLLKCLYIRFWVHVTGVDLNLHDYWLVVRKRWGIMAVVVMLSLATATAVTLMASPLYLSTSKLFVSTQSTDNNADLLQGSSFTQQRVKSYAELVSSPSVLDPVVRDLGIQISRDALKARITATVPINEVIIQIDALAETPNRAAALANAIANQLTAVVSEIEQPSAGGASPVRLSVIQKGSLPAGADSPKPLLNLALGLFIGLILAVGVALARESLDIKIRSTKDVESLSQASILGGIMNDTQFQTNPLIVHSHPKSRRAEAFRQLRTNVEFVQAAQGGKSLVVTSAIPGDGKTTTICNLAIALAQSGKRVLLIDCDLRKPKVARYLGLEGTFGLTSILIGKAKLEDVLHRWGKVDLHVLPAGKIPPNPSELLGSLAMSNLLKQLEEHYDVILLDSAPLLPVTDAAVLTRLAGGVALVVSVGKTTKPQLRAALGHLQGVDGALLGFVMNRIPTKGVEAYQYNYSYKYGYGVGSAYGNYGAYGENYGEEYTDSPSTNAVSAGSRK